MESAWPAYAPWNVIESVPRIDVATTTLPFPTIAASAFWTCPGVAVYGMGAVVATGRGAAVVSVKVPPVGTPSTCRSCIVETISSE